MGFQISNRFITRFAARKRPFFFTDSSGFTLVETLVALVILLTCLAAASQSYNTAINLSNKLNSTVYIATTVPHIRNDIKKSLLSGEIKGDVKFSGDLNYSWIAEKRSSSRTITGPYDESTGGLEYGQFQITLYKINLMVAANLNEKQRKVSFEYMELVWRKTDSR